MITGVLNTDSKAGVYITDEKTIQKCKCQTGTVSVSGCQWLLDSGDYSLFSTITRLGFSEFGEYRC